MNRSLLLLFSAVNLVIGTGAFIVTSILPQVAQALNVSVPAAGQAMTAYAVSTALLAPLMLALTGAWPRRRALVLALGLFVAGNAVCALANNLTVLLLGRAAEEQGAAYAAFLFFAAFALGFGLAAVLPLTGLPDLAASSSTASCSVTVPIMSLSGRVALILPCFT